MWSEILLEWINCLGVLEANIKDFKELNDGKLYKKLIELFSWQGIKNTLEADNVILKFLQDEYPEYECDDKDFKGVEHVFIVSLFLLRASQEPLFQNPMCNNLQHEAQVKIKAFLESIIPYGKFVKKETLKNVIAKVENDGSKLCVTPQSKALTEFFTSPAMRSVESHKLLTAKNRELRILKSELEVERLEKIDLQDDLKIHQSKIQNLQTKLQEKIAEIKALKEEMMRVQTPQSCKKNKNAINSERHYRKEIDRLEDQLGEKQCEIHNLETDNETLRKKLACVKQQCGYFKEKIQNYEKILENMEHQMEMKDRELANLRMTNEELQNHVKGVVADQSFEIDGVVPLHSPSSSFNASETMSTVIEIQLQEAKQESSLLKTQLEASNKQLESTVKMYKNATSMLEEKTQMLQSTEMKFNETINNLNKKIDSLQEKENSLTTEIQNLEALCTSQKESLLHAEQSKAALTDEINSLKGRIEDLEKSLSNENINNTNLNKKIDCLQEKENSLTNKIQNLEALCTSQKESLLHAEQSKATLTDEINSLKGRIEDLEKSLSNENINNTNLNKKIDSLQEKENSLTNKIQNLEALCTSQKESLLHAEQSKAALTDEINSLKGRIGDLEKSLSNKNINNTNLNKKIDSLQEKENSLTTEIKNLETLCTSQKESLLHAEQSKAALTDEINSLKGRVQDLEKSLSDESITNTNLNSQIAAVKLQINENLKSIEALTEQNNLYKTSIDLYNKNLKEITLSYLETDCLENLDNKTVDGLIECVRTILCNFNRKFESTKNAIEEANSKVATFQSQVSHLEEKDKQNIAKIKKLRETITDSTTRVGELNTIIKKNSEEISHLRQVELRKQALEKDMDSYKQELNRRNALIQTSEKHIKALKKNIETFKVEFCSMKKDILNQINEQKKYNEEKDKNILNTCKILYANYAEEQLFKDKLKTELANNNKELEASRSLNSALQNELKGNKEIINSMETKLTNTEDKLEEIKKIEGVLEKQRDQLKSENEKILLDLNDVNVKLKEGRQETHSVSDKLKIDDKKICSLIDDITNLKLEIERIKQLRVGWEEKTKDFIKKLQTELSKKQIRLDQFDVDMKLKQETLELVQDKYNKLSKESIISEMKMKEVITNLQEVRTNQDAVLKAQEKTLKEKCSQLEQLQKEYDETKGMHEKQLRELHDKYKSKVDEIKQNMKAAYNEQIRKLNKDQEQSVQERLESLQKKMELQYRKQADELNKYKAHVTDMSSRYWNIGEKLLSEQQEREKLQKELTEWKAKCQCSDRRILSSIENKISRYEQKGLGEGPDELLQKITTIQEQSMYERRYSIRSIQAMGNAFNAEDEEGEVLDNIYLADMRDGNSTFDTDRLSILKRRNALCKPHLKSSYPAEMQFHPLPFSEEEIKMGSTSDDIFNDSLSQSLLPEQKVRKKDKTQSSYKKPGPPTPAKNGGRLSLQSNELKSPNSRLLRERNKDRITTTPGRLRSLFSSRRQNETVIITPKSRRSSIFRKCRNMNER